MRDFDDDLVLSSVMRRILTDPHFNYLQIMGPDLVVDGRLEITEEEKEVILRVANDE